MKDERSGRQARGNATEVQPPRERQPQDRQDPLEEEAPDYTGGRSSSDSSSPQQPQPGPQRPEEAKAKAKAHAAKAGSDGQPRKQEVAVQTDLALLPILLQAEAVQGAQAAGEAATVMEAEAALAKQAGKPVEQAKPRTAAEAADEKDPKAAPKAAVVQRESPPD